MNNIPTLCGLLAIIFWSGSVAIIKSLSSSVGSILPTLFVFLSGGLVLLAWDYLTEKKFSFLDFSNKYHYICGSLFIICMITFYLAVGITNSQESAIGIGLVNYTWPSLTLILSIPILKKKAKPSLIIGIALATAGVFLAANSGNEISLNTFIKSIGSDALAYAIVTVAALSWGFYSNYSIKLGQEVKGNAVSIYMLATGLVVLPFFLYFESIPNINLKTFLELFVLAATNTLGYLFWDIGIRKGNMIIVSSFAYLTPLLSTLCTCLYLGLPIGMKILIACGLIISGAFVCSKSVR